ncbi:MAG: restriction endonuclease [Firmicutes bacterium]|nr:restriction endonuclease [Bacillota bacterium]
MRPSTLRDKLLELHANQEGLDSKYNNQNLIRCVTNYLHKKYEDKKIQRLIDDMYSRHNITEESTDLRRRNQLADYIDSIVLSRIRDSYKSSKLLDVDSLDELKFKALIKQIIIHFGYEILFIPINNTKNIDIIVHRKDVKIAVLAIKGDIGSLIGVKTIRQLRYIANYYHCEQALLFTNTYFCPEAFSEAAEIGVTLLDRDKLMPLVKDLIAGRQQEEKKYLLSEIEEPKNTIYLEGEIKFPKTKVQVVFVKYYIDENTGVLIFEGKLTNTGKKPASNINVEIKIFNRNNDCIYLNNFPVGKEKLESKEEIAFKCSFDEIPQHDWENLCRYQLKLEYKNTYKE